MRNHPFLPFLAVFFFLLLGCEKEPTQWATGDEHAIEFRNRGNGQNEMCFNFRADFLDATLDYFIIEGGEVLPYDEGWGAVPQPVTLGDISGQMGSIVTAPSVQNGSVNSATHYALMHFFFADDGESYFYTSDKAVCAPVGGTANPCHVNDQMTIVAGGGIFEGATGKIATHGEILITGMNGGVPIGTLNLEMHGRVCVP